ncbi:hypothetical protein QPK31_23800 [Massilia sp. YIM B02769]|uniref:hypothetical protein n=1 Tax=Massilia sp. YIM B02769 TaxID=3050129 RepID=UPI0025B6BE9F|nr:hypothetical protein [Massilia sp. YIM B02769]MDN4061249.1 hypothetical protein [Massilia sp. YIM B02769]
MKIKKLAVHNTALLKSHRRWPLKADYLDVPREMIVQLIEKFIAVYGTGPLLERGNFRQLSWISPAGFDALDLHQALEVIIDTVNVRCDDDDDAQGIKAQLEQHLGPLNGYIAVRLRGWPFVIQPQAAAR